METVYGTAEKIERVNIGMAPEKFGRNLLWLEYDYEPDRGYVSYTNKDDLLRSALEFLTENDDTTYEDVIEAVNWIMGLPEGPATLYLNFEEPQARPSPDESEVCAEYVNCKCSQSYIKLALPVYIDKAGLQIACADCHAALEDCSPALLSEVRKADLPHVQVDAA